MNIFRGMGGLMVIWGIAFFLFAHQLPRAVRFLPVGRRLRLRHANRFIVGAFTFLLPDFRWICAFCILLAGLLLQVKDQFGLKTCDAGFRTAGLVCCAGNPGSPRWEVWVADKIGGARSQAVSLGSSRGLLLAGLRCCRYCGRNGCAFLVEM